MTEDPAESIWEGPVYLHDNPYGSEGWELGRWVGMTFEIPLTVGKNQTDGSDGATLILETGGGRVSISAWEFVYNDGGQGPTIRNIPVYVPDPDDDTKRIELDLTSVTPKYAAASIRIHGHRVKLVRLSRQQPEQGVSIGLGIHD